MRRPMYATRRRVRSTICTLTGVHRSRARCEKDRRVIYVALTDQGTRTLADLDEPLIALHRKLLGHLSRAELKELIRLLEKVREPLCEADD